ncbi:MAG: hypothetical protein WA584_18125 [Pyrinomonadaceae bacterium]
MKLIKLSLPYILWGLFFASFVLLLVQIPVPSDNSSATRLDKIKLFNQDRSSYAEWDREKAVEFGLNQIANTFYYLFVAAVGLLAFIAKILIEPMVEKKDIKNLTSTTATLLFHSGLGCVLSIFFGFYTRLYFNNISDRKEFSLYDEFGIGALYQLITFFVATIIFVTAMGLITKKKLSGK